MLAQERKNSRNLIQHVVLNPNGGWSVKRDGAIRASRTFAAKKDAISCGKEIARRLRADLFVHKEDGSIHESYSFGDIHLSEGSQKR